MSDHNDEPWWGDESPVGTDRRRNGRADPALDAAPSRAPDRPPVDRGASRPVDHAGGDELSYRDGGHDPGAHDPGPAPRPAEPTRSSAQVFIPAPEDLPPFDEVVDPYPVVRRSVPDPDPIHGVGAIPDPDPIHGSFVAPPPDPFAGIPDAPRLSPAPVDVPAPATAEPPPAPDLARPPRGSQRTPSPARPRRQPIDRRRLATVYDTDGPRVRLGVAWFVGAMVATVVSPITAALVFAVAAGFAARQIVRAWGSVPWQADVAAGLGAVPVLAALVGTPAVAAAAVVALVVAVGCAAAPDGARLPGGQGRVAAMGILCLSVVPAVAGATFVLVRTESVIAAAVLLLIASAYEVGDYIVGSGASNPVEGPLAGITTATLVALPLALVLVEPYDAAGVALLGFAAAACPLGQVVGSAVLPGAGAHAPALRRIDTLLVLAPLWAAAAGAF